MGIENKIQINQPNKYIGIVSNVGADEENQALVGNNSLMPEIRMSENGNILRLIINMSEPRATGTCEGIILINGIRQDDAGQTVTIDAGNLLSALIVFANPIAFIAGDIITFISKTTSFAPATAESEITIETEVT